MFPKLLIIQFFILFSCINCYVVLSQDDSNPTPIPLTVIRAQAYIRFTALIMENSGCKLPCWWGFDVGQTSEDEWWEFVDNQDLHFSRDDSEPRVRGTIGAESRTFYPSHLGYDGTDLLFYFLEESVLTGLQIDISRPDLWFPSAKNISIVGILMQQGSNPEIYYIRNASTDLRLILQYPDQSFSIQYSFDMSAYERDNDGNVTLCLSMFHTKQIVLSIENSDFPRPLFDRLEELIESENSIYIPIEEASPFNSISTGEFISLITKNEDSCFQIDNKDS